MYFLGTEGKDGAEMCFLGIKGKWGSLQDLDEEIRKEGETVAQVQLFAEIVKRPPLLRQLRPRLLRHDESAPL